MATGRCTGPQATSVDNGSTDSRVTSPDDDRMETPRRLAWFGRWSGTAAQSLRPTVALRTTAALGLALAVAGCESVEAAPEDIDGLFHYFWSKYDPGSDEELALAVLNAHEAVGGDTLAEVVDGTLSEFSREQMDLVGMREGARASDLAGMYLVNAIPCSVAAVERIVTDLAQDELYEGEYVEYDRRYTSDADAYWARDASQLTWDVDISAEFVAGAPYSEFIHGGTRYVPVVDDETSPFGPVLLARTWMPEEAVFENDDYYFTQDYQIEVYYERAAGEVIHLYGLWRRSGFLDLNTDGEFLVRQILNALADWDDRTAELCQSGEFD